MTASGCINLVAHLDPEYGGISSSLRDLCHATAESGRFPSSIGAFCSKGELAASDGLDVTRFGLTWREWIPRSRSREKLRAQVERGDLVHIHGLWQVPTFAGAAEARRAGKAYVISAHGMLEPWALRNKRLKKAVYSTVVERETLRGAACLRALTSDEVKDYRSFGLANPVVVVPNGVTVPPDIDSDAFLAKFPELRGRRLVLYLGRIHYKKGPDILVKAWAAVEKMFPDEQLVIAGPDFDGTELKLRELAGQLGIADRVTFAGLQTGRMKWSALAAAELFVLPSHSEGFSVATLEALGCGKPVVISNGCHFREVADRGCGWVIDPTVESLADALRKALRMERVELKAIGERGRSLVSERYRWDVVGQKMADVYRWVLGGPRPTSVEIH